VALRSQWRLALALLLATSPLHAQQQPVQPAATEQQTPNATSADESNAAPPPVTMFPHPDKTWWFIAGQANFIFQANPSFPAKYSGPNSFKNIYEKATSRVLTLYTGAQVSHNTEFLVDIEEAGGDGLSEALGIAGFVNLDVVRNPSLSQSPYLARAMFHHVFAFSKDKIEAERTPFNLFTELPKTRLEIRFGKFSTPDFFDVNSAGSDSHSQFMNWTADNNGAYDYAADTRGYTVGALAEFQTLNWGVRFAELLMPTVANGQDLEFDLRKARSENLEAEWRNTFLLGKPGVVRILAYSNQANMGIYRVQNELYLDGGTPTPEITAHPQQVTTKYGFGLNFQQMLTKYLMAFGRFGWNNGRTESYAYTEVDQTIELGAAYDGTRWKRSLDKAGAVFISNAIKSDHQFYLAHGGLGFILGDGGLNYGRETIFEGYYNVHIWRGLFTGIDLQHVNNPGYNRDRGPVFVPGLRLHMDL
jgi:high affinity Mn2+ porin